MLVGLCVGDGVVGLLVGDLVRTGKVGAVVGCLEGDSVGDFVGASVCEGVGQLPLLI